MPRITGDAQIVRPTVYEVTVTGASDILFNRPPDMSKVKAHGKKQAAEDRVQAEIDNFRDKAYSTEDGVIYIPGENIQQSLVNGASAWGQKIPGYGNKTYTSLMKSATIVEDGYLHGATLDDLIPFGRNANGNPLS